MKYVLIGLLALGLLVTAVAADTQFTVSGTQQGYITVGTHTGNLNFGNFKDGDNVISDQINVDTGYACWQVTANDYSTGTGFMQSSGGPLHTQLQVGVDSLGYHNMAPAPLIWSGTTHGTFSDTIYFDQVIVPADGAGTYSMTVLLAGSPC